MKALADAPDDEALQALESKYARMLDLRRARDRSDETAPEVKPTLRALSQAFPGCLRELDLLSDAAIKDRLTVVQATLAGAPAPPWLIWIWAYHRLLAAVLWIHAGGHDPHKPAPAPTPANADDLAGRVRERMDIDVDAQLMQDAQRPPEGRLAPVVLARLAAQFGQDVDVLAETLFPSRRGRSA